MNHWLLLTIAAIVLVVPSPICSWGPPLACSCGPPLACSCGLPLACSCGPLSLAAVVLLSLAAVVLIVPPHSSSCLCSVSGKLGSMTLVSLDCCWKWLDVCKKQGGRPIIAATGVVVTLQVLANVMGWLPPQAYCLSQKNIIEWKLVRAFTQFSFL